MPTLWFILVAFMLTAYVVLDGFDLGAGVIHLFAARNDTERRLILRAIGPVWDGNEVWLIAAGGTLFFTFPLLYASSFSGFYLPLMIVLWLLMLRGVSIDGAGIGSCMAANKVPGVRAALCYDKASARNSREHNDSNVLTLGARLLTQTQAEDRYRLEGHLVAPFEIYTADNKPHLRRQALGLVFGPRAADWFQPKEGAK